MDVSATQQELVGIAVQAVELARQRGADQVEAGASYEEGLSLTVRLGELEAVERQRDRGLAITVFKAGQKGSASTADFTTQAITEAVEKAVSIAHLTAADQYAGLADAELMAFDYPGLELYRPWYLELEEAEQLALQAEDAARRYDARIKNSEGATVSSGAGAQAYANSHGFSGVYATSSHSINCSVVAEQNGALERDYWYTLSRDRAALDAADEVGREAARRAVRRLGARQPRTCRIPVIYPAHLARGFFGHLVAAIRGTSQYRKASFLLDACGQQIFPEHLEITEDPLLPGAIGSAPYDDEGVRTRPRTLVSGGVLQGYVLSSYSARRLGLTTTANAGGVHNLMVEPTADSLDDLLHAYPRMFLVSELLGQGVNTVTGDYSRGAAGFLIDGGEVGEPVHEVTIAGNLRDMFMRVEAVGPDIDRRGAILSGSLLVEEMTVAGA